MVFPLSEQDQLDQAAQDHARGHAHPTRPASLEGRKQASVFLKRAGAGGEGD